MLFYKNKKINLKNGQVMLLTAIFFMTFALTISLGFINPTIEQTKISNNYWGVKNAYYLAESGVEDLIYRSREGGLISGDDSFLINNETISLSASGDATSTLVSQINKIEFGKKIIVKTQKKDGDKPFKILDWREMPN
jgi:hypothetical protein